VRPRPVDWLLCLPFLVAFGGVLLVFDPLQRVARLFGQRPQEVVAGYLQIALVWTFRISGTRIEVECPASVLPDTPYLFVSNHQSMFDIPIFGAYMSSSVPKYVAKRELARWIPSISYNLRRGGNALIDRSDREQATQAIRELGEQVVARGVSAVLYPEGTRARTGVVGLFRKAGAETLFAAAPEIPVVPVVIDGSWKLLRFNLIPLPFGTRIRLRLCDPIERSPDEDRSALLFEARDEIKRILEEWRSDDPEDR